jgi:hypothetical protein
MKKQVNIERVTNRFVKAPLLILIAFSLLLACNREVKEEKLIPVDDLVDLLTEMYIADGLLSIPPIRAIYSYKDSTSNYIDIIKRHGYTKTRMDKTIKYYFENKPKKLENIYDQVLTRLNEKQALLEKEEIPGPDMLANFWKGKTQIEVPESGIMDSAWFSIPIRDTGSYTLEFTAQLYADDQSLNPRVTVYFWHSDSTGKGFRIYWPEVKLQTGGRRQNYSLTKRNSDTTITHISGLLLDCDPQKGRWVKHAKIENIVLRKTGVE